METLYITPKTAAERQRILEALEAIGVTPKTLTPEHREMAGLYLAMQEADTTKRVSRVNVMRALKAK